MTLRELPQIIKTRNRECYRVAKGNDAYIYKVVVISDDDTPNTTHYEGFRRLQRKAHPLSQYDLYEPYPKDEDFGHWAWCGGSIDYLIKTIKFSNRQR